MRATLTRALLAVALGISAVFATSIPALAASATRTVATSAATPHAAVLIWAYTTYTFPKTRAGLNSCNALGRRFVAGGYVAWRCNTDAPAPAGRYGLWVEYYA
jgi:hypothetical protein